MKRMILTVLAVLLAAAPLTIAKAQEAQSVELTLVSFAVARPVYSRQIEAFKAHWKATTGQEVTFNESYGGSAAQTRAILGGLQADILAQNLTPFVDQLVKPGFVSKDWAKRHPNNSAPATSVMNIMVRKDNPKNITTWTDLAKPGHGFVLINPHTGGIARWVILASYGPTLKEQGESKAYDFLKALIGNTATYVNSGREATDAFLKGGIGDAFITFENEAIFAIRSAGDEVVRVVPESNVQVDYPVTVIDRVVDRRGTRKVAEAFVAFLFSEQGQRIYAEVGYRPYNADIFAEFKEHYPAIKKLYTPDDFGGWDKINQDLFAPRRGLFDKAQAESRRR